MFSTPGGTTIAVSVAGLAAVLTWRVRETRSPVSARKIVIPPVGMAAGLSMFLVPAFRLPWAWAVGAFAIGAGVLACPLLLTSRLMMVDGAIMARRSDAFLPMTVALAAIRFLARGYLDTIVSATQSAGLLYLLALGMIVRWRAAILIEYRQLNRRT